MRRDKFLPTFAVVSCVGSAIFVCALASVRAATQDTQKPLSVATMPPVVVKTAPQSGDTSVDPSRTEIEVVFSKAMHDESWSWSQIGNDSFPATTGKPHSMDDHKTCVLPVKLEPGKTYAIWLNSAKFHGFRDLQGNSAVPYLLIFETKAAR